MTNTFLLAVDGSPGSERARDYAKTQALAGNAMIKLAYVIEWSPYTFNTPEENAERHKRREEEVDRAQTSVVEPFAQALRDAGVSVETIVRHGNPSETIIELARDHNADQIIIGRRGETPLKSLIFGSVAANLVQASTIPVTVVP